MLFACFIFIHLCSSDDVPSCIVRWEQIANDSLRFKAYYTQFNAEVLQADWQSLLNSGSLSNKSVFMYHYDNNQFVLKSARGIEYRMHSHDTDIVVMKVNNCSMHIRNQSLYQFLEYQAGFCLQLVSNSFCKEQK
tara:strand:- start:1724 stop:2128 length:405 start_codon:yes stop_codon:yes gene_type:complete